MLRRKLETLLAGALLVAPGFSAWAAPQVSVKDDAAKSEWRVSVDGQEAFVYNYGADVDLPHYWPLRSPSGKNMLTQQTQPYPHHRALWFGDTVQSAATKRKVSFYNALYTGRKNPAANSKKSKNPNLPPFKDHVRHIKFAELKTKSTEVTVVKQLIWEFDSDRPLLDERRKVRVVALGNGEYLLDLTFTLTATYSDVDFVSDSVHYAWPYIRINKTFSGDGGGTITNDSGATTQKGTHNKVARWIDYSNTVDGVTEGLAVFQWPDGKDHRWLTREYGTFGPRREDERSGKKFTVKKGESIEQRVGILVHTGDVKSGRVAQRYAQYVADKR